MLRRFRLQFFRRFEVRNQCQVHEQTIFAANIQRQLTNCFKKGKPLNIADSPPQFSDHDINIGPRQTPYRRFDFIRDVRNHLHRFAKVFSVAFLLNDLGIDPTRSVIRFARQRAIGKSLVVPQIQVGLGSVIQNIHFAVLKRAHRPRIDINVGVELLHTNSKSAPLENRPDGCRCQSFAERTNHPACNKNVFGHHRTLD